MADEEGCITGEEKRCVGTRFGVAILVRAFVASFVVMLTGGRAETGVCMPEDIFESLNH